MEQGEDVEENEVLMAGAELFILLKCGLLPGDYIILLSEVANDHASVTVVEANGGGLASGIPGEV